jgi:hypothetical protein
VSVIKGFQIISAGFEELIMANRTHDRGEQTELVHVPVRSLDSIQPAPENDDVYGPISWEDPEIIDLARSIKENGVQVPLLISRDGYIISGHRRRVASYITGLENVPVQIYPISREKNPNEFLKLLIETNSQRIKSTSALFHESLIKIDPKTAHQKIVNDRKENDLERSINDLSAIEPNRDGTRCAISLASKPFLAAVLRILEEQREFWPLSVRQVHYRLLGPDAPLTHASKPDSKYINDPNSYKKLTNLLTRARLAGFVSWEAIDDETRPVMEHRAFWNMAEFFRQESKNFLKGYWRNKQQSQPAHIEIFAEKLTVQSIIVNVARDYTIPLTITRGMSSLPPKKEAERRYILSGKSEFSLLVVADLDPAGDAIAEDLVKSFRRDFGIHEIKAYKVALTIDQVRQYGLAPSMKAKEESPTYPAFVERYGIEDAYELEAMEPVDLANTLSSAIEGVLDIDLYNQELAAEENDSAQIMAVREQAEQFFKSLKI